MQYQMRLRDSEWKNVTPAEGRLFLEQLFSKVPGISKAVEAGGIATSDFGISLRVIPEEVKPTFTAEYVIRIERKAYELGVTDTLTIVQHAIDANINGNVYTGLLFEKVLNNIYENLKANGMLKE